MNTIMPSFEIISMPDRESTLLKLEKIARTCYKSEDKITPGSASKLITNIVKRGHLAMIEFEDVIVRFIHNRGFSHEIVRHRHCSFAQESTRYVKYDNIQFIEPYWIEDEYCKAEWHSAFSSWQDSIKECEASYTKMINNGYAPQAARGVLPNDLKTEIVVKANLREWKHIFSLRCDAAAHPDMLRVMVPLQMIFIEWMPEIYA